MSDEIDSSELFSSPIKPQDLPARPKTPKTPTTPSNQKQHQQQQQPFDADEVREKALRRELEGVRNINEVIEGVLGTLERAKGNMGSVSQTVTNASTLLNTWTSILSQTEHSQRLILNPNWKGATQDLQDIENDALQKQRAAERRAAEEERRREDLRRRVEEREQARQAGTTITRGPSTRGTRGRGRGAPRGGSSTYGQGSSSSTPGTRGGSGIGRGVPGRTTRGGRGASRGVR